MCGRYTLYNSKDLSKRFKVGKKVVKAKDNFNVAPGQIMPVITREEGKNIESYMRWGFIPHWSKDIRIGYKLINCVGETCFEKPMWKGSMLKYRCLVPARGFYEWKKLEDGKNKQAYYIKPKDQDIFAFAGLWSTWKDVEGQEMRSFTIMTTKPNREMAKVHNRMPVILKPEDEDRWLTPSLERAEVEAMLVPYEDGKLELSKVSSDVNSPRNNEAKLIVPLPA